MVTWKAIEGHRIAVEVIKALVLTSDF